MNVELYKAARRRELKRRIVDCAIGFCLAVFVVVAATVLYLSNT